MSELKFPNLVLTMVVEADHDGVQVTVDGGMQRNDVDDIMERGDISDQIMLTVSMMCQRAATDLVKEVASSIGESVKLAMETVVNDPIAALDSVGILDRSSESMAEAAVQLARANFLSRVFLEESEEEADDGE